MSEAFQGVVFASDGVEIDALFSSVPERPEVISLGDALLAVSPSGRDLSMEYGRELASQVSRSLGSALHVAYDSRVGFRHSQIFLQGSGEASFGFETERWHFLREDGEPDRQRTFSTRERLPAGEYETAEDAITQGLRAFGLASLTGQELIQLACYGGGA